jgi:TRAP-type C4-dicarboxylate transport system permease small subunit
MNFLQYLAAKVPPGNIPQLDSNTVLSNALNTFYVATGIVAVIVIIIAGYMYVTSNGDPSSTTKAKNAILYAVIGLVVVISAFAITWFVMGSF